MRETCCPAALARPIGRRGRLWGWLLAAGVLASAAAHAQGQISLLPFVGKKDPNQATSSRSARQEAEKAMPWKRIDGQSSARVQTVLDDVTIYRRLAPQTIECDPDLYLHLVENPDLVVRMWEALGISAVSLERDSNGTFLASDGEGTKGRVELLYASPGLHVVYATGRYEGPLFHRPVRGQSVMMLRSEYLDDDSPTQRIRCTLDVFVRLEHAGVEMLAKTFQPLVGKVADHNFKETTAFMGSLSYTAAVNPAKVDRITGRLERVPPLAKAHLDELCDRIAVEASLARNGAASTRGGKEVRVSDRTTMRE